MKIDQCAGIWGFAAPVDTEQSAKLKEHANRVIERTVPFHDFAKMVDVFSQNR